MSHLDDSRDWKANEANTDNHSAQSIDILLGINRRLDEILITGIIQQTPHRVHVVDSGLMALQSLKKHKFDICLLSYELADLSGPEASTAIRNGGEIWNQVPVIGIIHQHTNLIIAECIQSGMNSFLTSPISSKKLLPLLQYYQEKKIQED